MCQQQTSLEKFNLRFWYAEKIKLITLGISPSAGDAYDK